WERPPAANLLRSRPEAAPTAPRRPPSRALGFLDRAEPALAALRIDPSLRVVPVARPMVDALAAPIHVAFDPTALGRLDGRGRDGTTAVAPLPGRHRIRMLPEPAAGVARRGFVLEQRRILEVAPVDPGVTFADQLAVDVAVAEPDLADRPPVIVDVRDLH